MSLAKPARTFVLFLFTAIPLFVVFAFGMLPRLSAAPPSGSGTIAYVRGDTADEIRLVQPDGTNDRLLWSHGLDDPEEFYGVWQLDWRPDGTEVAFVGNHENVCSLNSADVYAIGANGADYRRITQAPACDALATYPKGTVVIPVQNDSIFGETFTGFVYFQGAPSAQFVSLPPGGSSTLTFTNVADFGQDFLQVAVMIVGSNREISFSTAGDVIPNGSITTGTMSLYNPVTYWEAHSTTWRSDGSKVGYVLNFNSLFELPPHPTPLDLSEHILEADNSDLPDFVDLLKWGPPSRANNLLYSGNVAFDAEGIYLVSEGSSTAGQRLLAFEVWENVLGLAWLPDGSGFVYSRIETNDWYEPISANLFLYTFATQSTTRLTSYENLYAGNLSVSPDGEQIVFERGTTMDEYHSVITDPDIWVMNRDGSGQTLLIENGRAPDWGITATTPPPSTPTPPVPSPTPSSPPLPERLFLPMIKRG